MSLSQKSVIPSRCAGHLKATHINPHTVACIGQTQNVKEDSIVITYNSLKYTEVIYLITFRTVVNTTYYFKWVLPVLLFSTVKCLLSVAGSYSSVSLVS